MHNGPWVISRLLLIRFCANWLSPEAVRQILKIQLGTKPLTKGDTEKLRSVLLDLQSRLNSIIKRIPEPEEQESQKLAHFTANELPDEDQFDCPEQYHSPVLIAFHKWTRIILSLFIDKVCCLNENIACTTDFDIGILYYLPALSQESSKPYLARSTTDVSASIPFWDALFSNFR